MKACYGAFVLLSAILLLACHEPLAPTPEIERPALGLEQFNVEPVQEGRILSIPETAFIERAGVPGVFVLRYGLARFQMVKPGRRIAGEVEILAGLSGGEILLISKLANVNDGSPVKTSE